MTDDRLGTSMDELEFLVSRHDRLIDSYMTTNQIIHTTFYISVVAIAGTAGAIPQFQNLLSRTVLYVALAFLFIAMYGWNETYLSSRRTMDRELEQIIETVNANQYQMDGIRVPVFFSTTEAYNNVGWEAWKEHLLKLYYLGVALLAIVILVLDFGASTLVSEGALCIV